MKIDLSKSLNLSRGSPIRYTKRTNRLLYFLENRQLPCSQWAVNELPFF